MRQTSGDGSGVTNKFDIRCGACPGDRPAQLRSQPQILRLAIWNSIESNHEADHPAFLKTIREKSIKNNTRFFLSWFEISSIGTSLTLEVPDAKKDSYDRSLHRLARFDHRESNMLCDASVNTRRNARAGRWWPRHDAPASFAGRFAEAAHHRRRAIRRRKPQNPRPVAGAYQGRIRSVRCRRETAAGDRHSHRFGWG